MSDATPPPDDAPPRVLQRMAHARESRPGEKLDGAGRQAGRGVHSRGYLPHVEVEGGTYFVTFRLADSIPAAAVQGLAGEIEQEVIRARERWRLRHPGTGADTPPPVFDETHASRRARFAVMERWLDAGHGQCWLRRPEVAGMVAGALRHFENDRYLLPAWCIMANHVHVVLRPLGSWTLSKVLHTWKSWTSKQAARIIGPECPARFWMPESYNHWCRDAGEVERSVRYTLMNPVKARFCATPADYPWSGPHPPPPAPASACV